MSGGRSSGTSRPDAATASAEGARRMKFTRLRLPASSPSSIRPNSIIEPGLTGVVGPNGCGKSNLVEALRWVMGESSYKAMRASGMDDVIFSGSGNRPARNIGRSHAGPRQCRPHARRPQFNTADVLEVTRRIEREAGSVYRDQRPRSARPRRAAAVRRRLDRRAFAGPGAPGADRRADRRQAAATRRRCSKRRPASSGLHSRRHEAELRLQGRGTESRTRSTT